MYLDRINEILAPLTGTVRDYVATSFPIPTKKGMCVFYFNVTKSSTQYDEEIEIIKAVIINDFEYEEIPLVGIRKLLMDIPQGDFDDVYQQRKKCEKCLDDLLEKSNYMKIGFEAFEEKNKCLIANFLFNVSVFANMVGMQALYDVLLNDLKNLLGVLDESTREQ